MSILDQPCRLCEMSETRTCFKHWVQLIGMDVSDITDQHNEQMTSEQNQRIRDRRMRERWTSGA